MADTYYSSSSQCAYQVWILATITIKTNINQKIIMKRNIGAVSTQLGTSKRPGRSKLFE